MKRVDLFNVEHFVYLLPLTHIKMSLVVCSLDDDWRSSIAACGIPSCLCQPATFRKVLISLVRMRLPFHSNGQSPVCRRKPLNFSRPISIRCITRTAIVPLSTMHSHHRFDRRWKSLSRCCETPSTLRRGYTHTWSVPSIVAGRCRAVLIGSLATHGGKRTAVAERGKRRGSWCVKSFVEHCRLEVYLCCRWVSHRHHLTSHCTYIEF
jgi:hypothetical protein